VRLASISLMCSSAHAFTALTAGIRLSPSGVSW
jgi:hypothetical protein